ncbi:ferredoxin [Mycobacterium sp. E796]|uniref:ferredoxin n=1 Tax=Mycobacterium sp. E796 TaxID=1834151 RepID=UPI0007FCA3AF|nr:ferredoxin [Mycobacterium sp. E796]OBI40882.1 ferredoxin [Mycobacterium sp. E796]
MADQSSLRTDNRLDEVPMTPVACDTCGAAVLVRKSSWDQTSVQWNAAATARCSERAQAQQISMLEDRGVFLACSALSESIRHAVRRGELAIVDETAGAPNP